MNRLFKAGLLPVLLVVAMSAFGRQYSSPNGKITLQYSEGEDRSLSFTVTYVDGKGKHDVLTIPTVGMLTKKGRGEELKFKGMVNSRPIHEIYGNRSQFRILFGLGYGYGICIV